MEAPHLRGWTYNQCSKLQHIYLESRRPFVKNIQTMAATKLLLVIGATGAQGRAVVKALLEPKEDATPLITVFELSPGIQRVPRRRS